MVIKEPGQLCRLSEKTHFRTEKTIVDKCPLVFPPGGVHISGVGFCQPTCDLIADARSDSCDERSIFRELIEFLDQDRVVRHPLVDIADNP
jgi:hypothetical protein